MKDMALSRRTLLKAAGLAGTLALPACSTDSSTSFFDEPTVLSDEYAYPEVKELWCAGQLSCGMICGHKMHVNKYGRMVAMTSGGDLRRDDPENRNREKDESVESVQKRACVKGYSYIKRYYQPDRLRYPLMRAEGKERGDLSGFKRVSWETAVDKLVDIIKDAQNRAAELKYLPIKFFWRVPALFAKTEGKYRLGHPAMAIYGNASFGNIAASLWDGISYNAAFNSLVDMFNSKMVVVWGLDATTTNSAMPAPYWYYMKAKEAGIPIVVIDVKYSDTAASMGTGATYTGKMGDPNGMQKDDTVKIPAWITLHPGTDCAMSTAMAYVIYANNLHDEAYLRKHVFGFFKNDELEEYDLPGVGKANSLAPDLLTTDPAKFSLTDGLKISTGNYQSPIKDNSRVGEGLLPSIYCYNKYPKVPDNQSFEEYLQSLGRDHGGYDGVLQWAENITGVSAKVIEAFARLFATIKPVRLEGGGGPQRVFNGMSYTWLNMALAAMTGNSSVKGGGPGFSMFNEAGGYSMNSAYFIGMYNKLDPFDQILVSIDKPADLVTKGQDERTRAQIAEDFKFFHNIDKDHLVGDTTKKMFEIDTFIDCGNNLCTMPNSNKYIEAVTRKKPGSNEYQLKNIVAMETFMTTTAMFADLVLPCKVSLEKESVGMSTQQDIYYQEQIVKPMADVKTDDEMWQMVGKKLGFEFTISDGEPAARGMYDGVLNLADHVYKRYPNIQKPAFDEFKKAGKLDFSISKDNAYIGLQDISPVGTRSVNGSEPIRGGLSNTTGLINLWSPFYALMRPGRGVLPYPRYVENPEGYEAMLKKNPDGSYVKNADGSYNFIGYTSPHSGRNYKLQLVTDKPRHRSHTILGNVAIIADNYPQNCMINPSDAAIRGIKEGDLVYVYNDRGCSKIPAELTHRTPPGVIRIFHGAWYRPHPTEKVKVWLDTDLDGDGNSATKDYLMPVDIGGCENILTLDRSTGPQEPYVGGSIYVQGCLVEVSTIKPGE